VTPSFDNNDPNGYLRYIGPHCPVVLQNGEWVCQSASNCECDRGGHAVLVTGIIDNSLLPAGAPLGQGGGYLIVKNSWGACFADAGYIYIPYQWIKDMVYSATVLGDIS
jgi:C1A family cysteine protease